MNDRISAGVAHFAWAVVELIARDWCAVNELRAGSKNWIECISGAE
jgi:hypothetical protein